MKKNKKDKTNNKINITINPNILSITSFIFLITGIFEFVMAIPFIGWLIGVSSLGIMWIIGGIINIIAIIILIKEKKPIYANIIGVGANVLGWIPLIGWMFHCFSAILLVGLFFKEEQK